MKCRHCGNEIDHVKVHWFNCFGSECESNAQIVDCGKEVYSIEVFETATALTTNYYQELTQFITCPECKKFPFKGSVDIFKSFFISFGISVTEDFD